ncbi:hypothetical protein KK062_12055 [Fulvivirgaceae bacterium PWU5]|uniref:Uncharacterized protein n=1 Tax=Dawidia cretensis TaxID=2782350 RepID=A0AAP2E011_9BACT|nr:hypothetical protein [Dawidia cretensis]MBT1708964.1 hypothetical protein [Dawidia cretensis]
MNYRNQIYQWEVIDHNKEFTAEDFFNLNGSFNTIKFNPKHNMTIKKSIGMDIYRKSQKEYICYDLNNTSIIRPFSTKILYNKETGTVKNLLGSNRPIYDANEEAKLFNDITVDLDDKVLRSNNLENIRKYIRFFFDHVSGKKGFFYVCESYEEIQEAINIYYKDDENKKDLDDQKVHLNEIKKRNDMTRLRVLLEKHFATPSRNNKFKISLLDDFERKKYSSSVRAFMVFKNALFKVNVNIEKDSPSKYISLDNETLGISDNDIFGQGANDAFKEFDYDEKLPPFDLI